MGKKTREPSPPSSESGAEDTKMVSSPAASPEPSKKRKRSSKADKTDEIEIDVSLPEPLSKAEARKAKKAKTKPTSSGTSDGTKTADGAEGGAEKAAVAAGDKAENGGRTVFGIWIGNLPFTADKTVVRVFFTRQGQIPDDQITRVHMPTPTHAQPGRVKPNNKGFAYIDFSTKEAHEKAIALSESLMTGRKVLIKDAKSFEGRPANATATSNALNGITEDGEATKVDEKTGKVVPSNPSSKRVFVGNLTFDVTKEDLEAHYAQAGEIEDVHMATFEDSGKCKGYGWIRFVNVESAEAAVKGFVFKEEPASDDEEEEEEEEEEEVEAEEASSNSGDSDSDAEEEKKTQPKKSKKAKKAKKPKKRKWFINRLQGRTLRCEFAEDSQTRYKKRFGKERPRDGEESAPGAAITEAAGGEAGAGAFKPKFKPRGSKDERQEQRKRKHIDARKIAPGAALANAPRASGAIVEGTGKKISFD